MKNDAWNPTPEQKARMERLLRGSAPEEEIAGGFLSRDESAKPKSVPGISATTDVLNMTPEQKARYERIVAAYANEPALRPHSRVPDDVFRRLYGRKPGL